MGQRQQLKQEAAGQLAPRALAGQEGAPKVFAKSVPQKLRKITYRLGSGKVGIEWLIPKSCACHLCQGLGKVVGKWE